jgi:hypothetical protein
MWIDYLNAARRLSGRLSFGQILGGFCVVIGTILVIVNSMLLARGAARWGSEGWERTSYGIVAAAVPWVITVTPILVVMMWRLRHRLAAFICCVLWTVFVVYNFVGTTGAIAAVRDEVISSRTHEADTMKAARATRERLTKEYNDIPSHRPVDTVIPLLAKERAKWQWEDTDSCKEIRKGSQRKFCEGVANLEAEIGSGKRALELQQQISQVDGSIMKKGPVSETADWSASVLADLFQLDEHWLSRRLPIATPFVLEILCMVLFWYGFIFFGGHGVLVGAGENINATAPSAALQRDLRQAATQVAPQPPQLLTLLAPPVASKQRELVEWFFRECARPHPSGTLPEADWYAHYVNICHRQGDTPMSLDSFRWFARKYVPAITQVEGHWYYGQILPYLPQNVA